MKPIYINLTEYTAKLKKLVTLNKITTLPYHLSFDLSKKPSNKLAKKIKQFLEHILAEEQVHIGEGIAFHHPNWKKYNSEISRELKKL